MNILKKLYFVPDVSGKPSLKIAPKKYLLLFNILIEKLI